MGFARMTENMIRSAKGMEQGSKLGNSDKIISSAVGERILSSAFSCTR